MKQSINEYQFTQAFVDMNRAENFTYDARKALFEYFEQLEEDTGEEIELDVIAICCEFSEFGTAVEAAEENGYTPEGDDDDEKEEYALRWLNDHTTVIEFDGGVVIQGF